MKRHETPFATHGELIVVRAVVTGPRTGVTARLVFDTGATYTTITPEVVDELGYGPRDGLRRTRVQTAIGSEHGYVLVVAELFVLGVAARNVPVHVFDLGHDDIEGLLGLNVLSSLNYEVRSAEHRILVEPVTAAGRPHP